MAEISYRGWGLISLDQDPTTGELYNYTPPMLTAITLDSQASLVFQMADREVNSMVMVIELTSLSAGAKDKLELDFLTGSQGDQFNPISSGDWSKEADGMFTAFSTRVSGLERFFKLVNTGRDNLVVNRVSFST